MPQQEIDIEKVDGDKFVHPRDALSVGYYGYTPDETDDREYSVAHQGALAEKANQPPEGGSDAKSATARAERSASVKKETAK